MTTPLRAPARHARVVALIAALAALAFGVVTTSPHAAAGPLTVTPITWDVLGLDSNNVNVGPNVFPVGVRVCNTGSDPATSVVATWAWKTSQNSFTGPADGSTVSVGTMAAGACTHAYFEVTLNRSPASRKKARDYQITLSGDGGLSTAGTQRTLYIQGLVSQNRNHTKKLSGPNGCNLAYTVCDPAPANILVGRTYTYKLYAETSTAYKQLETFANFPSTFAPATSTSSTYSNPAGASSTSIYGDACGWNPATRACVGPENIPGGKAGGRIVVTYVVKAIAVGSGTLRATIYDFSGASYHYNADFDSVTLTTTPLTARYELAGAITGNGKVTSSPAGTLTSGSSSGIDCGGAGVICSVGYGSGTVVTLTAQALGADTFTGWSGGGCSGVALTCIVTMNQSRSVTAAFTGVTSYPLAVSKAGSGTVTADVGAVSCGATCTANYASGTLVTLTAAPSAGWTFNGWSGEGCSGTGTCVVTMSQARSVTATFIEQTFGLDVAVNGNGVVTADVGTISCGNGDTFCTDIYSGGTLVTLTATPGAGQTLVSWSGACSGSGACVVTMDQARAVVATFTGTASYPLEVGTGGAGTGTVTSNVGGINCGVTCSATYTSGTIVTLTATASGGSFFNGWSGDCSGLITTCMVTMSQARNVTADFGPPTQLLTVTKAGSGTGTVTSDVAGINCGATCSASFVDGTVVTLTAVASSGSLFTGWSGEGCSGTGTCVVTMSAARNVTATFVLTYTLAVTKTGSGAGTVTSNVGGINCGVTCSADYTGGTVVLTAVASAGSRFAGWSGEGCTGTGTCSVTMSQARTVSASFVLVYTLTVSKTGSGSGTVTADVGAINCGATCSADYDQGTSVTLTAAASAGSRFNGWSGEGCSGTGTCIVTMSQARTVSANFVLVYTLTVSKTGSGAGTVTSDVGAINCGATCSADYDQGTPVTLSATASAGSRFAGWSGEGCSGTSTCTVTMSQLRSVSASFVALHTLTVSKTGSGTGTVTSDVGGINCGATCSADYDQGTSVTLSAAASAGSRFTGWSGEGCTGTGTCNVTMTQARSVSANFIPVYTLTVGKTGSGAGTVTSDVGGISCGVTCTDDYDQGTSVILAGTASAGSRFNGWSGEGCSGTGTCTVTMSQARTVSASFVALHTLTVTKTGSGSGTVTSDVGAINCGATCSADYDQGTSVTLSATAPAGSRFAGWSGEGCSGTGTCTVTMSQARTVSASFVLLYTLTVSKTGSGAGTVTSDVGAINCGATCSADYDQGTSVTLTGTASAGSRFAGWSGEGCSGTGTCILTMSQARSVSAAFVALHTLTVTKTGSGSGTVTSDVGAINCGVTCTDDYDQGTSVTLSATASFGSRFAGWSGEGCSGTGTCTVTMSQARTVSASFVALHNLTVTKTGSGSGTVSSDVGAIDCGATCADDYDEDTIVTLSATAALGSRLSGWSGEGCSGNGTCVVTMSEAREVTATFVALHTLTVTKTGSGTGTVSSDVGAIDCGATCADDYDEGTSVTLSAAALAGSSFAGWSGEGCAGTGTCTVTMSEARDVSASFMTGGHTLTVSKTGSGAGTVSSDVGAIDCGVTCSDVYDDGTPVTLTAAASATSRFTGWSGEGCSGTGTCTVTMSQARNVSANFVALHMLTVAKTGSGSGTVIGAGIDCGATCSHGYAEGTSVTLSATAGAGSRFAGWSGACSGTTRTCTVTLTQARNVTLTFIAVHTLTVSRAGSGKGSVSSKAAGIDCGAACANNYDDGTTVTLTAVPIEGSRFVGWSGEGCTGIGTCTVTMSKSRAVTATFVSLVRLRVTVNGRGTVRSAPAGIHCAHSCAREFDAGTHVTLEARAKKGRWFLGWSAACSGRKTTCTVTMSRARLVRARFARELALRLQIPKRLVYHLPEERATIRARATWRGKPLAGAHVALRITCPGRRSAARLRTGNDGQASFAFGTKMRDALRIYRCKVSGRVKANRQTARPQKPGVVSFIHPLWLHSKVSKGRIVVRIWGRAHEHVQLFADGIVVGRPRIGRAGWVDVVSTRIQHGNHLWVTGPHGHVSHHVAA